MNYRRLLAAAAFFFAAAFLSFIFLDASPFPLCRPAIYKVFITKQGD
jgi:hypothetical protein